MTSKKVMVVKTGTANLASVLAGLSRAGADPVVAQGNKAVQEADYLVLPGVGSFVYAMQAIGDQNLADSIRHRFENDRPTLTICLGLQVLAKSSEEGEGVAGLGLLDSTVTRFSEGVCIPQLGWNSIEPTKGCRLLRPGYAYFANSYKLEIIPKGWEGAISNHGGSFVAAIERGTILACQFHPELSGPWGHELLVRWLGFTKGGASC